jgi:tetratricopeptide (TPR) repeat protein
MSRYALIVACGLALVTCKSAANIHPRAVEHNEYGTRYLEQGDLVKAQERFELALEFNPDYPEPYNNLCLVWIRRSNFAKAKELCIKALRLNNDFAEAHNNLGYIYLQEKSWGKAHDSFRSALKVNPDYVEARYNLCLALLHLKKGGDARTCYDKIIETNGNLADPHHGLCLLDIEEGDHAEAVKECTRAVELDPKFVEAFYHLGLAYQGAGKHCEAQEAYKACVALEENNAECRNNLASAARHCALQSPHLDDIRETANNENSAINLYKLGCAERDKGLLPEAERHFKKCLRLDGRFGLCHCALAEMKRRVAENAEVQAYCKKCLDYSPDDQQSPEREMCLNLRKAEEE